MGADVEGKQGEECGDGKGQGTVVPIKKSLCAVKEFFKRQFIQTVISTVVLKRSIKHNYMWFWDLIFNQSTSEWTMTSAGGLWGLLCSQHLSPLSYHITAQKEFRDPLDKGNFCGNQFIQAKQWDIAKQKKIVISVATSPCHGKHLGTAVRNLNSMVILLLSFSNWAT